MSFEVITICNRIPNESEPYYHPKSFFESLKVHGVTPTILGMEPQFTWRGLMSKPRLLRAFLREKKNKASILICVDAWDIVFVTHPQRIVEKWQNQFSDCLLFNGEGQLYPPWDHQDKFPLGPYRFLNSGFFIGHADKILEYLEFMDLDSIPDDHEKDGVAVNPCDQEFYARAFVDDKNPVPRMIDVNATICQTLHDVTEDDLEFDGDRIRNKRTGSRPQVFHGNGNGKGVLEKIIKKYNLPL